MPATMGYVRAMGIEFADGSDREVLALIDRSHDSSDFSPQDFYAFADVEGQVQIRWMKVPPRLIQDALVCMPLNRSYAGLRSCRRDGAF